MRWYLHPLLDDVVIQTLILFSQDIPPGGHSGKFRYQGNQVIYILRGKGVTVIDGVEHPWETGDVVQLPIRRDGIVVRHVNGSQTEPCRFVACEPNHVHSAGVDRASGFEQLEVHSHYGKDYAPQL
jgi:gentisate 1,2-dioxygenase